MTTEMHVDNGRTSCGVCSSPIGTIEEKDGNRLHVLDRGWLIAQPEGPPGYWHKPSRRQRRPFRSSMVGAMADPADERRAIQPGAEVRCQCRAKNRLPDGVADSPGPAPYLSFRRDKGARTR